MVFGMSKERTCENALIGENLELKRKISSKILVVKVGTPFFSPLGVFTFLSFWRIVSLGGPPAHIPTRLKKGG